jgi:predicted transcriptional regulator
MVTLRLDTEKKKALDAIAAGLDRDRSYVLNQAIEAYLETHRWQLGHIKEGLHQAQRKQFATDAQVKTAFAKWRR